MVPMSGKYRIGTRNSRMAMSQATRVKALLEVQYPERCFEIIGIATRGDSQPHRPLRDFRRPGIFTSSLEDALNEGQIQIAVHSLKDLPIQMPPELALGAILPRDDPSDSLVTYNQVNFSDLPPGARIGTSSPRRTRMVRALEKGWQAVPLRGNVDSRIAKLDRQLESPLDGIIVATCGLYRLGLEHRIVHRFDVYEFLTAPAQGAIALQCLAAERDVFKLLRVLHHQPTHLATEAERGLLRHLGGGCALPAAAYACIEGEFINLAGGIWSPDGQESIFGNARGSEPEDVSRQLAETMIEKGCEKWL